MASLPFPRVLVLVNPAAGRGRAPARAGELATALAAEGHLVELTTTSGPGDAGRSASARAGEFDLFVAAGGDGTLGELATALTPQHRLALLPCGTANVLARDLRLPRRPADVARAIRAGHTRALDVARVAQAARERACLLACGVGIDGAVLHRIAARRRGRSSPWTYARHTIAGWLGHRLDRLRVELDGEPWPDPVGWVVIANLAGYGRWLRLAPEVRREDGCFEVYLFGRGGRLALAAYGLRALFRRLPGGSCRLVRAARVRVEADRPTPVQIDGEAAGTTPLALEVDPAPRHLVAP